MILNFCRLFAFGGLLLFANGIANSLHAEDTSGRTTTDYPAEIGEFSELIENSPFLRPLNLSRSLVLTGVAQIEGSPFAVLLDSEADESYFVTSVKKNEQGWQLLSIEGNYSDLESVIARISVRGDEVIQVRYDPKQLSANQMAGPRIPKDQMARMRAEARNYRRGLSSDGFPGAPPRDLQEKLGRMSEDQRARIMYQMQGYRNRGVGGEERQRIFRQLVERASR